ncbi:NADP-dependent oxidoreductase domain-containing protein [Aspergillus pseudoustus]|uniref:NADP-dependent oxidoreductase domain-containing protein n=1 Tax=Aspergillus pseudoustus TaxID=1810923 RepID=A0ABR4KYH5_9EURO
MANLGKVYIKERKLDRAEEIYQRVWLGYSKTLGADNEATKKTKERHENIGRIGYGLMGLTRPWVPVEYPIAAKIMRTALEQGANFRNGGIHYGTPTANSLHLLKYYFTQYPEDVDKVVLSIKGGYGMATHSPNGTSEGVRASVETALSVLDGVKKINIFECARVDPIVPIETTIGALAQLVVEGKIGGIGLSTLSAATICRAHAVHPIAGAEIELSLFTPEVLMNGVAETCRELNIPIIAYSPVARGWLAGQLHQFEDLSESDMRRHLSRFKREAFENNAKLAEAVRAVAKRKGVTVPQVAMPWVSAQGAIPIPGATTEERVRENCTRVELDEMDLL